MLTWHTTSATHGKRWMQWEEEASARNRIDLIKETKADIVIDNNTLAGSLENLEKEFQKFGFKSSIVIMPLRDLLPPVLKSAVKTYYDHSKDPWFKQRFSTHQDQKSTAVKQLNPVPPYSNRNSGSKTLPVTLDAHGNVAYDAIVRQDENANKIVYSEYRDLVPKMLRNEGVGEGNEDEDLKKKQQLEEETALETSAAIEKIVSARLSAVRPKKVPSHSSDSKYIKYKPSQQSAAFNSGAKERIIRMMEKPVDPLNPPLFKHKKLPPASGSPPVPVLHSPPRPVTVQDQQDWKIPPCISNWKNPSGYTIPLDKRLAADGRGLQDVQINDTFAELSESLCVAEQKAREAVAMRSKLQKELMMKEKENKEQELRALALKARLERTVAAPPASGAITSEESSSSMEDDDMRGREGGVPKESREEQEQRVRREKIREERRRERRLEAKDAVMGKKSKITRDRDRDISEKVALGMANSTGAGRGGDVMYDQRLFNQEKGMDSGFAADDQYNVYTKGLFTAQTTLSALFRPNKDVDAEIYGGADEQQTDKIMKTERFKPDKAFAGTSERAGPRDRLVEFEKDDAEEEADPFGLDQFLTEVNKGKKAMGRLGTSGTMHASAGSSMRDDHEEGGGGSGRTRIGFERGH
ncbi:hypothetical protein Tsubulata_009026 [Turnera subulata]|uniref:SKI-interacting protein SKIP SNW domain-containing protein n=1 Tax=Turnera subulata TaxID=218843 RepID=A0A9Q0FNI0_9ROSI|nr:hypothetical protein Tsubulata_009026 [Turnera subulata]